MQFFQSFFVASEEPVPDLLQKIRMLADPLLRLEREKRFVQGGSETKEVCDLYGQISDALACPSFSCGRERVKIQGLVD